MPDETEPRERARRGVRRWVASVGRRTDRGVRKASPYGIYAFLTAAAVAPVAGPSLGASGEFAAVLDQLGGMGTNYLSDLLADTAKRLRGTGGDPSEDQWRDAVADAVLARLESADENTAELREEIGGLLRAVDGVGEALTESAEHARELHQEIIGAIAVLGGEFDELKWMLADLRQTLAESTRTLSDLQRELLETRATHRRHGELTHRFLVAVARTRQWLRPDTAERPRSAEGPCPYPGLASFQADDAEWFHGREDLVVELLAGLAEQLDGARPLVVVGASGAGKSSVLRAGLLPAIAEGGLPVAGSANWPRMVLTPGRKPLTELAARVAAATGLDAVTTADRLRRRPAEFGALARQAALNGSGNDDGDDDARLVLVVDQFEEVFTHGVGPEERLAFTTALTHAAPAVVVLAVRADFYEYCTRLEPLAPLLTEQVVVGPMTADQLRGVITEPARRAGVEVEPALPDRLLADLGVREGRDHDPGSLPLLAHALRASWHNRDDGPLTVAAYLRTGGIEHAVADTAERIHADLSPAGQRDLRSALLRMVTVLDGGAVVRRQAGRRDVAAEVLDPLIAARLVTVDAEAVRISHEALLTAWPRLREWIDRDRQELILRGRLDDAARYWLESGRDEGALYRGAQLAAADEWARDRTDLTGAEREFLRASTRAENRSTRRLRGLVAGLATLLVVALVAGGVALRAQREAEDQRRNAQSRAWAAQSQLAARSDPLRAKRLALRAWRTSPTTEARSALLSAPALATPVSFDSGFGTALSADLSPDGGLLAVGGPDGRIALWNTDTSDRLDLDLSGHTEDVWDVEFSPDGSRLATASGERDGVRVWELPSGTLVRTLPGAFQVAWRPDGDAVATFEITDPPGVTVRHPDTGTEIRRLRGTGGLPYDLAYNRSGDRLAIGYDDGTVDLWRTGDTDDADGTGLVARHRAHSGTVDVAFSADLLATAHQADATVRLWHPRTGAARGNLSTGGEFGPSHITFSEDGVRLFTAGSDTVTVWEVAGRRRTGEYRSPGDAVTAVLVSRDGRTVAAATASGGVTRWTRDTLWYTRFSGAVTSVAFSPDGTRITAADGGGAVHTWRVGTGEPVPHAAAPDGAVIGVRYTPAGDIVTVSLDGTVAVTDPSGGAPRQRRIPGRRFRSDPAVSPDGRWIAAVSSSPIDAGDRDQILHVWRTATLEETASVRFTGAHLSAPVFGPDGERLAVPVGEDIRLWRLSSGTLTDGRTVPTGHEVYTVAFAPDTTTLATAGRDGRLELRDAASGKLVRTFAGGHPSIVRDVVFSPDGESVATGTVDDPVIRLWDTRSGTLSATLTGHVGPPNDITFSADGTLLASASQDTSVGLWFVRPSDAVRRLCGDLEHTFPPAEPPCRE